MSGSPIPGRRPRVLWVGAFPASGSTIVGGFVTDCRALRESSFAQRAELVLIDSTQPNNPAPPLATRAWLAMRRVARFVIRFEQRHPDAVLLFVSSTQASVAEKGLMGWYARLRGAGVLIFPRGGAVLTAGRRSPRIARRLRWMMGGAHVVLCQGPAWHAFAVEALGKQPAHARTILNWTATEELLAIGRARAARAPDAARPVRLVFAGWVNREKGTFELVEACRRLRDAGLAFELTLVGDGVAAADIRAAIEREGLGDRVRMAGWLAGDALRAAYADADVFVLPSWSEGLPNAMIEAMAAGLAVVVSAVGAIPGTVTDGEDALLVPPRDSAALERALARVIADPALRARLADAAHRTAAERFGVERAADAMLHAIGVAVAMARPTKADPARPTPVTTTTA